MEVQTHVVAHGARGRECVALRAADAVGVCTVSGEPRVDLRLRHAHCCHELLCRLCVVVELSAATADLLYSALLVDCFARNIRY